MAAIEALKNDTVIVFIDGSNLHLTPKVVQEAVVSDTAFGPLPIVTVFDAAVQKPVGAVGYRAMKDVNGFKEVTTALANLRGKEVASGKPVHASPELWMDRRGRTIRATYLNSTGTEVTVRLENGKESTLQLSALSEASRKRVGELAKQ